MEEEKRDKTPTGKTMRSASPESTEVSAPYPACDARGLVPAADRIADGVSTVAGVLSDTHTKSRWYTWWDHTKPIVLLISIIVGAAFTVEQFLAAEHAAAIGRVETLLSTASEALGSPDLALQANAVRTLPRIGKFATYNVPPGARGLFRHVRALFGLPTEYPYFEQSWMLFRDVASLQRELTEHVVSSAILRQGAVWEHRIRRGEGTPIHWIGGSLLFQARIPGVRANDIDLEGLQFGAADLTGADLSGSDCTACGFLGARLDSTKLRGSKLEKAFLAEAYMNGADMSFARLTRAVMRKVQASNAVFLQTDLTGADFTGAHLDNSTFSQAVLLHTDFTNASLRGVRFLQSDVSSATFDNADVQGADFRGAVGFSKDLLHAARNGSKALLPNPSEPKEDKK